MTRPRSAVRALTASPPVYPQRMGAKTAPGSCPRAASSRTAGTQGGGAALGTGRPTGDVSASSSRQRGLEPTTSGRSAVGDGPCTTAIRMQLNGTGESTLPPRSARSQQDQAGNGQRQRHEQEDAQAGERIPAGRLLPVGSPTE